MEMSWQIQSLPKLFLLTHLQSQATVFHTNIKSVAMILHVFWYDRPQAPCLWTFGMEGLLIVKVACD